MQNSITQLYWFAVYTTPRAEKKIAERFEASGIEFYLPLHKQLKRWSDRKKWVIEPLFKSYIFVKITAANYYSVLNTHGVVRFITFSGKAVPIPEKEIETIKRLLIEYPDDLEVIADILPGTPIEVTGGPMMGVKGELVEYRGEKRAAIKVEYINQSVLVNIPAGFISPLKQEKLLSVEH
jgi:transcriptional antiterminator RfaH